MKEVLLIIGSKLPVPPVKGGAVETLVYDGLLKVNENNHLVNFRVISPYDEKAVKQAQIFKYSKFYFVKQSSLASFFDRCLSFFMKLFRSDKAKSFGFIFRTLDYSHKVKKLIKQNADVDAIVEENSVPLLRAFKSKKLKSLLLKTYYHAHSIPKRFYGTYEILSNLHSIISVSDYVTNKFEGLIPDGICRKVTLFNVVDSKKFKPSGEYRLSGRERLNLSDDEFVVLFAGRICEEKGIQYLFDAFRSLKSIPDLKLVIVGSNFYQTKVTSQFQQQLIQSAAAFKDKIIFTGYTPHSDMPILYNAADIVVLPSNWGDPCPLTVFEALSSGVPLITTNDGGIPEIVGDTCIVLDTKGNIAEQIANSIACLYHNRDSLKEMSKNERGRALSFGEDNYLPRFVDLIS